MIDRQASLARCADRVFARADALAGCSERPGQITRTFATPAMTRASELVISWMRSAGMEVRRDDIGNISGRRGDTSHRPVIMLGSHLDTVRDGGRWDGVLGILVAIAAVEHLRDSGLEPVEALEVVAFADEEGVRFGRGYLGSSPLVGTFQRSWLDLSDADGVTMREAVERAGGDPKMLDQRPRAPGSVAAYVEVHIEQGPVLDELNTPLGVVTGIAGQSRAELTFAGVAGHAGTVPMTHRRDALVAAAGFVVAANRAARAHPPVLATVGRLRTSPGAANVIPGRVVLSLDVRSLDDGERTRLTDQLRRDAASLATETGTELSWRTELDHPAVACDPALTRLMANAVADIGLPCPTLGSGAGHDAAVLAAVAPIAILFVRCDRGISHHPAEAVCRSDVVRAIEAVCRFLELAGQRPWLASVG